MTEINNLDHAIEISIKKYLYSQIFKKGTQKMPALVSHPTVWSLAKIIQPIEKETEEAYIPFSKVPESLETQFHVLQLLIIYKDYLVHP